MYVCKSHIQYLRHEQPTYQCFSVFTDAKLPPTKMSLHTLLLQASGQLQYHMVTSFAT